MPAFDTVAMATKNFRSVKDRESTGPHPFICTIDTCLVSLLVAATLIVIFYKNL